MVFQNIFNTALFSSFKRSSSVPSGNSSKAAFVGANTVNGPALERSSTYSTCFNAATKVVWSGELTATLTTSFCDSSSTTDSCPRF